MLPVVQTLFLFKARFQMESSFKCGQMEQRTHKYHFTAVLSFTGRWWSSQKSEAGAQGWWVGQQNVSFWKFYLSGYNGWKLNRSFQHFTQWLSEFRSNCRSKYPFILWACSENCSGFCIFSVICHQTCRKLKAARKKLSGNTENWCGKNIYLVIHPLAPCTLEVFICE